MNRFRAFRHLLPCFGESIWSVCDCDPDPIKRFDEWTPLLAFNDHFSGESGYPIPPSFSSVIYSKRTFETVAYFELGKGVHSHVLKYFNFCISLTFFTSAKKSRDS